jgi:hypothetical protein
MATLTPPTGWRFAWLDEIPDGAAFRFHAEDKDRAAEDRKAQRPHSLVIIPLPCPTCGGTGRATDQPSERLSRLEEFLAATDAVEEGRYLTLAAYEEAVLRLRAAREALADQPTVAGDG